MLLFQNRCKINTYPMTHDVRGSKKMQKKCIFLSKVVEFDHFWVQDTISANERNLLPRM